MSAADVRPLWAVICQLLGRGIAYQGGALYIRLKTHDPKDADTP